MALETYTTSDLVRRESGFKDNVDVTDPEDLDFKVAAANAKVFSAVSNNYAVPLSSNSNYTASYALDYLKVLATKLATCMVLTAQYVGQGGDLEEGVRLRCKAIEAELKELRNGNRKLFGSDGAELGLANTLNKIISGFPMNSDLADTSTPENIQQKVRMDENF